MCCLYMMAVFTTNMTGTQAKARRTKKIWRPFCKIKKTRFYIERKRKNASLLDIRQTWPGNSGMTVPLLYWKRNMLMKVIRRLGANLEVRAL